jgi:hypothetical protein
MSSQLERISPDSEDRVIYLDVTMGPILLTPKN